MENDTENNSRERRRPIAVLVVPNKLDVNLLITLTQLVDYSILIGMLGRRKVRCCTKIGQFPLYVGRQLWLEVRFSPEPVILVTNIL
jgi:hypothetical protein